MTTTTATTANGSAFQFSGIATGLDTSSIITQLMAIESQPQTRLKNTVTSQQAQVSTLQSLNSALASMSTQAASFAGGSTWTQQTTSSSVSSVSVTATSAAATGSLGFTVNSVASAAQLGFSDAHVLTDVVATPNSTLNISLPDGTATSVATGDGTLSSVITALNGLKDASGATLLRANAISVSGGQVQLLVSAAKTGAGSLAITDAGGAAFFGNVTSTAGTNASLTLGAGITATSATNTFTNLISGVNVTLGPGTTAGQAVTIGVTDDGSSRATAVKAFLGSINSYFDSAQTATAYGTIGANGKPSGGGVLAGDPGLRAVANNLTSTIYPPGGATMATLGIDVDKTGNLTFDQSKFVAAYQADPAGTQAAIMSWVDRVKKVSDNASLPASGTLSQAIKGMNSQIAQETSSIADWDTRLQLKQQHLETMYTALEAQMSRLQAQQSWLSSQLSSLDSSNK